MTAVSAVAPPGGCVVFVSAMTAIARPTDTGPASHSIDSGTTIAIATPTTADTTRSGQNQSLSEDQTSPTGMPRDDVHRLSHGRLDRMVHQDGAGAERPQQQLDVLEVIQRLPVDVEDDDERHDRDGCGVRRMLPWGGCRAVPMCPG